MKDGEYFIHESRLMAGQLNIFCSEDEKQSVYDSGPELLDWKRALAHAAWGFFNCIV